MEKTYSIVIDTLGSDKGPEAILDGAKLILDEFNNVHLILVGDKDLIAKYGFDENRIKIIHTLETITNYDNPVEAFYKKPNVSIFKAVEEASKGESIGLISAGNSGALLVSSIRYLLDEKKTRPCMAAILPTTNNAFTCLVDTGASIDVSPNQLLEFARLGTDFMRKLYKIDRPRVGLLSNGVEPTKGNKLVKEAHKLLAECPEINFVGNIEGNKTLNGLCDVLVCDGFAGNQVLKNSEGMAANLIKEIIVFGKKSGHEKEAMMVASHLMETYDFESLGAGIMLGAKVPVMKCRGSSGAKAIRNAAHILLNIAQNKSIYEGEDKREKD